ncbi:MAG: TRAM domain-containing protein, partial [Bacteroidota bacterium]
VFQYSHEEGTIAHDLPDDIPAELKAQRANRIMEIQQSISLEKNEAKVGQTMRVLFDRKEGGYFVGRTEADSPEVDNEVLVDAASQYLRIGDFADIQITAAEDYDLYGTLSK